MVVLRGWNEDFNDSDGDYIFGESLAQFHLTIPESYTPGDAFTMTFTGGLGTEGVFPTDVECQIAADVYMTYPDVGPLDAGPFSDSGLTYAIGNSIISFVTGSTPGAWTAEGSGAPLTTIPMGLSNIGGSILIDGTPFAPDEGSAPNPPHHAIPIGWFPDAPVGGDDYPENTIQLHPGDVVTIAFFTACLSNDSDNPTRSFYPYITGVTVNIGSETIVVDLAAVKTGFNIGAASVPWGTGSDAPWNAYGTVATSQPPQAAGYQDMWIAGGDSSSGRSVTVRSQIGRPQRRKQIAIQTPHAAPVNTVAPVISGPAVEGNTLAVSNGSWTGFPSGYAYQWKRNGAPITDETSATYLLVSDDNGTSITCDVTATNDVGPTTEPSNSVTPTAPAAPINTSAPFITGSLVAGNVLTGNVGTWTGVTSFTYAWTADGTPISDQIAITYLSTVDDEGSDIRFVVTGSGPVAPPASATSAPVTITAPPSGIPISTEGELFAALLAATGGEIFLLDADTDFGAVTFPATKDFSANPVTIQCQSGTEFNTLFIGNFSGAAINGGNVYGSYQTGAGLQIVSGSSHITTNGLSMNSGDPDGTQTGAGFNIRNATHITLNGAADADVIEVSGRGAGGSVQDASDISINGLTFRNIAVDGIIYTNTANLNINACLGTDWWPSVDSHPDFIQGFGTNSNLTIQNNGFGQIGGGGEFGGASQGITLEHTSSTVVIAGNWIYGGLANSIQQSAGVNTQINDNFVQGFTTYGSRIIVRDGSVNCSVVGNTATQVANYTAGGINPGFSESGTTHVSDTTPGNFTQLDAWLTAHPLARARP